MRIKPISEVVETVFAGQAPARPSGLALRARDREGASRQGPRPKKAEPRDRLLDFVQGLALWDDARNAERQDFERLVVNEVPLLARRKYEDLFRQLAVDFPEVQFWTMLREHAATRTELSAGLAALQATLAAFPTDTAGHAIAALRTAHTAALDRPVHDGRGLPEGLQVPSLRHGYIDPLFSVAGEADGSGQAADLLTRYLSGDVGPDRA